MRHPVVLAESMYLTMPGAVRGDMVGLLEFVTREDYYDNFLTRMLANVPAHVEVTEEHFKEARMILENKFLIGMTNDVAETVQKRLKLYFGWEELPSQQGCEMYYIKNGVMALPPVTIEEGGHYWRAIQKINLFDMKLYARAMSVFGQQKMRMPVHPLAVQKEREVVNEAFARLRNVDEPLDESDVPFFWHIPKASGTTVKEILSRCYGLVRTEMVKPPQSLDVYSKYILNVDLTTKESIEAAKNLGFIENGLADVVISQLSLEGATVFSSYHMGRAFTIMRHPVKLAISLFYYRQIATWEPTYRPEYKDISLQDYIELNGYYDNWMVRILTNAKTGGLNDGHLDLTKSIIKNKFLVGISDHMPDTFRVLEKRFGWKEMKEGCVKEKLNRPSNSNKYPEVARGSKVWNVIAEKNKYDMGLYYYALELFGDVVQKMSDTAKMGMEVAT
mmetsp:Transcript_29555/g.59384  ORF Transcript_29555/g.59384 Transcript_29555/m.59384 type:complete len:447 (+) Transcript_29555:3-1343(+)